MKQSLLSSLFFLFFFSINAQTVVVATDKMNVFYMGVDNPVVIAVEGVADEKLKVSTDNGVIIKTEKGHFNAQPERTGTGSIIIEWDGKKEVKQFKVKAFPNPKIKVGEWNSGFIYANAFSGMVALIENMDIDAKCSVVSYTCTLVSSNEEVKSIKVNGPINQDVSKLLSISKKGDKVIFTDISVRCPGDKVPRLLKESITRTVK